MKISNIVLVLCVLGLLVSGVVAASNGKSANQLGVSPAISLEALKGQAVTDLLIHLPPEVAEARKIQVKAYDATGASRFSRNFINITPVNGTVSLQFNDLQRGDRVDVRVHTDQYGWLDNSTQVLNRPDLIIASAATAGKVVAGDTLSVNVSIQEKNGDTGAEAAVSLLNGETVLDTRTVSVGAGGMTSTVLSAVFTSRGEHNLSIRITNSVPAESDETNNIYNLVVGVVSPDLTVSNVSAPSQVTAGERFEALATITELSGEAGASATVMLLENGTVVLDSKPLVLPAGGSGTVTLSTLFTSRGNRSLSIRITNSVPAEYDVTNNVYNLAVRVVSPDLAVSNVSAPSYAGIGQIFEVRAELSELYGETGANATVALFENNTVLDIRNVTVPAGGLVTLSLNGSVNSAGAHNMTVRIVGSVPQDTIPGNNEQNFVVIAKKSPESMSYTSAYRYQNTSFNFSHYITADSGMHVDNYEESELGEDEVISFTALSGRILSFPVRISLNITDESGGGNVYEETVSAPGSVVGSRKTFSKYYPDSGAFLTLNIDDSGTSISLESRGNVSVKRTSSYLYWWFKGAQVRDASSNSSNGKLVRALGSLDIRIEVEDGSWFLGGSTVTGIVNSSTTGGWTDATEGLFEERRSSWTYSGNSSGETVI